MFSVGMESNYESLGWSDKDIKLHEQAEIRRNKGNRVPLQNHDLRLLHTETFGELQERLKLRKRLEAGIENGVRLWLH